MRDLGYRLATLTNSPNGSDTPTPLNNAGLSEFFDHQFSVSTARVYKPATQLYRSVASELGVPESACVMVAAHNWDTIGAQGAGMRSALIVRPGNAPLTTPGVPEPTYLAPDLIALVREARVTLTIAPWQLLAMESTRDE